MTIGEWRVDTAVENFLDISRPLRSPHGILILKISDLIAADPQLADYCIQKPEMFIKLLHTIWDDANPEIPINSVNVIPYDDYPISPITELAAGYNHLVRLKGHITSTTEDKIITSIYQVCREQNCKAKDKPIAVKKARKDCPACRMYYSESDTIEKNVVYRDCIFEEVSNDPSESMTRNISMRVYIPKEVRANILRDEYLKGDKVDICGIVKKMIVAQDKQGNAVSNFYLELVGIRYDTSKIFTDEQIAAAKEYIIEHHGRLLDVLSDHIFSGIYKLDAERKAVFLTAYGLQDDAILLNGKSTQTAAAIIGDPATAKTTMAYQIIKYFPKTDFIGALTTESGIVGGMEKRPDGSWHYLYGKLPRTHKGVFIVDEANVIGAEALECVVEAVSNQILRHSKIHQKTQKIFCKYLFLANPPQKTFDPFKPIAKQHNLPPTLLDRCDFVIFIKQHRNADEIPVFAKYITGQMSNPKYTNDETMKAVVYLLLQNPNPTRISEAAYQESRGIWEKLKQHETQLDNEDAQGMKNVSPRALVNINKLAAVHARLEGNGEVTQDDVIIAWNIYRAASIDPIQTEYQTTELYDVASRIERVPQNEANQRDWLLQQIDESPNKCLNDEEIIERAKTFLNRIGVERLIEKMKRNGDIYEPVRGQGYRLL